MPQVEKGKHRLLPRVDREGTPYWCLMHGEPDRNLEPEPMPRELWKEIKAFMHRLKVDGIADEDIRKIVNEKYDLVQ